LIREKKKKRKGRRKKKRKRKRERETKIKISCIVDLEVRILSRTDIALKKWKWHIHRWCSECYALKRIFMQWKFSFLDLGMRIRWLSYYYMAANVSRKMSIGFTIAYYLLRLLVNRLIPNIITWHITRYVSSCCRKFKNIFNCHSLYSY